MASKQSTVDFIADQLGNGVPLGVRKMFGEFMLYWGDQIVALVADDQLHVKITAAGRRLAPQAQERPPYPGAKAYLVIPADRWEDRAWLRQLLEATAGELPAARPKNLSTAKARPNRRP